jgi:hypothetical protein
MDETSYAKVLLYVYPQLQKLAEAIEVGIEVKACLSFKAYGDPVTVAEKIVEEIERRETLLYAQDAIERILRTLSEEEKYLLEYKYFRRKSRLKGEPPRLCSRRQYFRKQNLLLHKVVARLREEGCGEGWFFEEFGSYAPFMKLYRAICEGRERSLCEARAKSTLSMVVVRRERAES